jgi:hypothetical protein
MEPDPSLPRIESDSGAITINMLIAEGKGHSYFRILSYLPVFAPGAIRK